MIKQTTTLTAAMVAAGCIAATGSTASGHPTQKVIHLTEVPRQFQFVDVAPQGGPSKPPSEGDEFVIGARLVQSGKGVGTANLVCTVTRPGRTGLSQCAGTLTLPHGDITISGISRIATNGDLFAVTGGTGAYARARGTLRSRQTSGDNDALTVRIER